MPRIAPACGAIAGQTPSVSRMRRAPLPSAVVRSSKLGCAALSGATASIEQHPQRRVLQRQRQTRAHHAAADDGDIARACRRMRSHHAAAISASISSAALGTSSVSTSQPARVTTTSSSMRTPTFQKRRDTPRVPAAM